MLNVECEECPGEVSAEVKIEGYSIQSRFLVASELVLNAEVIIGIDLIKELGGVFVNLTLEVQFGRKKFSAAIGKTCEESN